MMESNESREECPENRKRPRCDDDAPLERSPPTVVVDEDDVIVEPIVAPRHIVVSPSKVPTIATEGAGDVKKSTPASVAVASVEKMRQRKLDDFTAVGALEALRRDIADRDARIDVLQQRLTACESEIYQRDQRILHAENRCASLVATLDQFRSVVETVMLDVAQTSRRDARRAQHQLHFELGHIIPNPSPGQSKELWVEGNRMRELHYQMLELTARQKHLESLRKEQRQQRTAAAGSGNAASSSSSAAAKTSPFDESSNGFSDSSTTTLESDELIYTYKHEEAALTAAIHQLKRSQQELEGEKKLFLKEIRRIAEEDSSIFATAAKLGSIHQRDRYVLLHLLGKGGFSEVWKAFDLQEGQYVACKVHRPDREASFNQRIQYSKHATRELAIMKSLCHSRLTKVYDSFYLVDHEGREQLDAFVSVLEYSSGTDLDTHLKSRGQMTENDTRIIMMQLASALKCLSEQPKPVIHYDLKPANILFHSNLQQCLDIKVTDFGLSKILEDRTSGTTELTSQGTGTYWYLPPECFDSMRTPQISTKVDIWSAGIIMYQMLYGKRPFAEGASQRQIWNEKLISTLASKPLEFPPVKGVSEDAKELIRKCLTVNVADRIDVMQLCNDPFFKKKIAKKSTTPATAMPPPS